jgi:acetyl-CoA decarbonylase/synthase complex subunit epsilon
MKRAEPWQKAETAGPEKAFVIKKPEIVVSMVKFAKRPIIIVGHEAAETDFGKDNVIDYLVRLSKSSNITIVATAHLVKEFINKGFKPPAWMPLVDIANRLRDPGWKGLDGEGLYDIALFIGFPYYLEWLILSGLKNFSLNLKTISLGRFYQPHASWSFPNTSVKDWKKNLEVIEKKLNG